MVARKHKPTLGRMSPSRGLDDETQTFYRKILESGRVSAEHKREVEAALREQRKQQSLLAQARNIAAQQARKTFRCEGCSLEFLGILAFAEHDEETSHMTHRGRRVEIDGDF